MPIPVRFTYYTGLTRRIFRNPVLAGSWDASGRPSVQWSRLPMRELVSPNGDVAFEAVVPLDEGGVGQELRWGVAFDMPGRNDAWGIATEENDLHSTRRERRFVLQPPGGGGPQEERYYLTHCRRLGAQKHFREGVERPGIRYSVWAPNARAVEVVFGEYVPGDATRQTGYIDDGGGGSTGVPIRLSPRGEGIWASDDADPALQDFAQHDHRPYMFRITRDDGSTAYRTDLYSRCQIGKGRLNPRGGPYAGHYRDLDGTKSCSVVIDPDTVTREFAERQWPEIDFMPADEFWRDELDHARPVPHRLEDLVIYELHVGSLGFGTGRVGDFADVLGFLDHLGELGVNAVELMPVMEFRGDEQWGYGSSHFFALEFSAGGRDQLKHLIRACHQRGIAVLLDVVYNHYTDDAERVQWMYDTTAHERNVWYWYEGHSGDYANLPNGEGGYVDNDSTGWAPRYHEEQVRKLFISSAVALAEEFHVDGFRFDQTTSIHAYNKLHADGRPLGNVNAFGAKLLRECCRTLRMVRPELVLMAEDHSGWDQVTRPTEEGGLGFDATWFAGFYHHLVGDAANRGPSDARLLQAAGMGDDRPLAMGLFAEALRQSSGRTVVYSESHDEAGNAEGTHRTIVVAVNGAPLVGDTRRFAEARSRWCFAMAALSAGTPMFLMGEEVGAARDLRYDRILESQEDLAGERAGNGARLFRYYSDAIRLRLRHGALRAHALEVLHAHDDNRVVWFRRWNGTQELLVAASLANRPFGAGYVVTHPSLGTRGWREIFNSDAGVYGGDDVGNGGRVLSASAGRLDVVLPACGVVVLEAQP